MFSYKNIWIRIIGARYKYFLFFPMLVYFHRVQFVFTYFWIFCVWSTKISKNKKNEKSGARFTWRAGSLLYLLRCVSPLLFFFFLRSASMSASLAQLHYTFVARERICRVRNYVSLRAWRSSATLSRADTTYEREKAAPAGLAFSASRFHSPCARDLRHLTVTTCADRTPPMTRSNRAHPRSIDRSISRDASLCISSETASLYN